jgi:putative ABC transport system permease protein
VIRHIFKLIWNRRRSNFLVVAEVLFSFLALFGIVTMGVYYADNYRQPLGFNYDNVWLVEYDSDGFDPAAPNRNGEAYWRLFHAIKDLPQVEAVSFYAGGVGPFWVPGSNEVRDVIDGRPYVAERSTVSDEFLQLVRLNVTRGRWFSREDDALPLNDEVIVLNERFARHLFEGGDPVGRRIPKPPRRDGTRPDGEYRIVGVIEDYRPRGEFAAPANYFFSRQRIDDVQRMGASLLARMRDGTTPAFHEPFMARLFKETPTWTFRVKTAEEWRESTNRDRLLPLIVLAIVVGSLLLMVVMGLMGVLWQNVTQRTQEIGLRRAKGATATRIYRQILGEVAAMTTFAVAIGTVLLVQLPLMQQLGFLSASVFIISLVISTAAIYLLTALCGFYPAQLATRVHPAEALHDE